MARHPHRGGHRQKDWQQRHEQEPGQICPTTGKRSYGSEEEARATAEHQMKTQHDRVRLRAYLCLYCDGWHLTSKDP